MSIQNENLNSGTPAAEAELCQRAVAGDHDALTALLQQAGPQVRGRLAAALGDGWRGVIEIDDVLQVTYLEAFLRVGRFEPRGAGAFLAWLSRIADHNLQDAIRELTRAKRLPPGRRVTELGGADTTVALWEKLGGSHSSPSRRAATVEVHAAVKACVARLPEDYARVVRLYDLEARPVDEVAAALGRSAGAVYMLRARALDRLRELLGAESLYFSRS